MKTSKAYWTERAKNISDIKAVTHADIHQRDLEINSIIKHLRTNEKVVDIGCGNGYSTRMFSKYCDSILGLDFVPDMIERAEKENHGENIRYEVGDVLNLILPEKPNLIITQRCLINLLSWDMQKQAISNIVSSLPKDGRFLMLEGVKDGRDGINKCRIKLGLLPLKTVDYNLDFEMEKTNKFLQSIFDIIEIKRFGIYEFITRVIYPMYKYPNEPNYGSKFHDIALKICNSGIESFPELSKFAMWVLKRK